jgi:hypothetical protein
VTDTKYIYTSDTLLVYRGGTLITTLTVTAKTQTTITVTATGVAIQSADELWVNNSFNGQKIFRWATSSSGTTVQQYDTFKLTGGQNDRIKMMTNIGNVMVIANSQKISFWNDYSLQSLDVSDGCVSDNGYTKALGSLYFIGYKGIYSTTGESAPKLESSKIEKYITGATKTGLENSAAGTKGFSIFFSIGDVTLYKNDGSIDKTLSDVCLEKNLIQQNWFIHTNIPASQFATYIHSTDPDRLEFSSTTSPMHIYELFYNETDSDDEIPFRIDTQNITLCNNFENFAYPRKIIVESERGSGISCFVSLDEDNFYQLKGEAKKGISTFFVNSKDEEIAEPPRCRNIKISLRDFSKKLCKISRIAIIYTDTIEEEIE